jgi:hypothetical protein
MSWSRLKGEIEPTRINTRLPENTEAVKASSRTFQFSHNEKAIKGSPMRSTNITGVMVAMLVALATVVMADEPRTGGLLISFTIEKPGRVSLAVYDQQGRQVRTLLAGEPQAAGKHSVPWDGLDRAGNAMPVGSYTWKLLLNDGLEADYLSVIGQSPIDPAQPWVPTVGSHEGPSSVALGAGGALYQGSRNSEGPPVVMKLGSETGPVLCLRRLLSPERGSRLRHIDPNDRSPTRPA